MFANQGNHTEHHTFQQWRCIRKLPAKADYFQLVAQSALSNIQSHQLKARISDNFEFVSLRSQLVSSKVDFAHLGTAILALLIQVAPVNLLFHKCVDIGVPTIVKWA